MDLCSHKFQHVDRTEKEIFTQSCKVCKTVIAEWREGRNTYLYNLAPKKTQNLPLDYQALSRPVFA